MFDGIELRWSNFAPPETAAYAALPGLLLLRRSYPLAHLRLARAYAAAGETEKSRQAYQDFLALWKDADSDIPLFQEAKADYARLH